MILWPLSSYCDSNGVYLQQENIGVPLKANVLLIQHQTTFGQIISPISLLH